MIGMGEGEGSLVEGMGGCDRWCSWLCIQLALQNDSAIKAAPGTKPARRSTDIATMSERITDMLTGSNCQRL